VASSAIANECVKDVVDRLNSIPDLKGRSFHVMSDNELLEKTKGLMYTCSAVIYGGITSVPDSGATHKVGLSATLTVDVLLFFKSSPSASSDPKVSAVELLDTVRAKFKDTRSPTGHFWRFTSERPVEVKSGVLGYLQRWTSPVQMS